MVPAQPDGSVKLDICNLTAEVYDAKYQACIEDYFCTNFTSFKLKKIWVVE